MNFDINTAEGMANSIAWFNNLTKTINDGGMWAVPRSGTLYRVFSKDKTLHCVMGVDPSTTKVATAAGWTVVHHD